MSEPRAACRAPRRAVLALLIALGVPFVSACSEQREFKRSDGHCVVHDTDRFLGIPLFQQEYDCHDDK